VARLVSLSRIGEKQQRKVRGLIKGRSSGSAEEEDSRARVCAPTHAYARARAARGRLYH